MNKSWRYDFFKALIWLTTFEQKEVVMPVYEFYCRDCDRVFEVQMRLDDFEQKKDQQRCLQCNGSNVERKISMFEAKTSKKS